MGFRFKKSIKIAPGIKLNLNKKSTGVTFGGKGFHYTVNSKGKRTASVGIPGTGLSYSTTSNKKSSEKKAHSENNFINETEGVENMKTKSKKKGCLPAVIISLVIVGIIGSCGTDSTDTESTTVQTTVYEEYLTEEVTTAPSTVPVVAVVSTTDAETTTTETETTTATTTEKETTTKPTTTQKETTTEKKTTTKKAETTKKETTTEKKTTPKATTTKKVTTTKKPTTTKKVTTTKKKSNTTRDNIDDQFNGNTVYITPKGKKYHYDPDCGGKNSYEVGIDEVGNRTACGTCAK